MGKLRDFLSTFIKYTPKKNFTSPTCTHPYLPEKQHYTKLIVNAHDHCRSCEEQMCLVCSEMHVQNHCSLNLRVNHSLGQGNLYDFNIGFLMEVSLANLKCICGKPLNHDPNHGICAACGLASCSDACHEQWQKQGNCTYSTNYYQKPKNVTMRSILFSNIKNIQKAKIKEWNIANKSTLAYIACYAKAGEKHVYLQRGYRNYGIPQPQLIERMKKVPFGLDYTTHIERICTCNCVNCVERKHHSVGNCQTTCLHNLQYYDFEKQGVSSAHSQCECDCDFCRSGIIVTRHTKLQCLKHCYRSDYNVERSID